MSQPSPIDPPDHGPAAPAGCPVSAVSSESDPPFAPDLRIGSSSTTPYEDYVQADVLTHLQQPLSDDPGEMVFLVTTQVMELWFTVIVHEWRTAAEALRRDDLPVAMDALRRSAYELEALNAAWKPLARLTPAQFNAYRSALGDGSGFQSAMYRRMEFLLGEKSASMLVPHRGAPGSTPNCRRPSRSPACGTRCCGCSPGAAGRSPRPCWSGTRH